MELLSSQVTCWMCVVTCWCPPGMFHDRLDTIIGVWVLYVGVLGIWMCLECRRDPRGVPRGPVRCLTGPEPDPTAVA